MQDIAVQFEKHCWIHSVSLFSPQVHVGRSPLKNYKHFHNSLLIIFLLLTCLPHTILLYFYDNNEN
ncbi:hypothetical protein [Spiroplasma endosymbiont of Apeira syringaria]|uniref:hypothetical protein n=1 Tax=Spiroplasma endosymbiont of Apeira syringaria TaxID=3066307 RepID=UPI0030CBFCE7